MASEFLNLQVTVLEVPAGRPIQNRKSSQHILDSPSLTFRSDVENQKFSGSYAPVLCKFIYFSGFPNTQQFLTRWRLPASESARWPYSAATVADSSVLESGDDSVTSINCSVNGSKSVLKRRNNKRSGVGYVHVLSNRNLIISDPWEAASTCVRRMAL